jgi:hypothetical protein
VQGTHVRTRDVDGTLNRLHEDAEAQRQQEDAVDERTEDLGALPAVRVARVLGVLARRELAEENEPWR